MKRKTLSRTFDKSALLELYSSASRTQIHRKVGAYYAAREDQMADEKLLYDNLAKMFPDQKDVEYVVARLKYQSPKERPNNIYTEDYLPYHTRDNNWLARYAAKVVSAAEPQARLHGKYVENFVAESSAFDIMRREYEQRLVRAQIPYMLEKPTPNGLMDINCCPHNYNDVPNYDNFFRNEVIRCLSRFGIDDHSLEIALERNADLWRKQTMIQSFENVYYPLTVLTDIHKTILPWWRRVDKLKQAHQVVWLKVREYEYYQEHHDIIDELGLATENMLMKPNEVTKLRKNLVRFEHMRDKMFEGDPTITYNQSGRTL